MSLSPLLNSSPEIQIHAAAAMCAFAVGVVQFALPKGTKIHRTLGWFWAALMLVVAVSSLFVNTTCSFGPFSSIHLLTILTLVMLPLGLWHARKHHIRQHATTMIGLFIGGLIIAGAFTFVPGRIMHDVVFGTASSHERCWPVVTENGGSILVGTSQVTVDKWKEIS
jgi:uncharacterized membrane protein